MKRNRVTRSVHEARNDARTAPPSPDSWRNEGLIFHEQSLRQFFEAQMAGASSGAATAALASSTLDPTAAAQQYRQYRITKARERAAHLVDRHGMHEWMRRLYHPGHLESTSVKESERRRRAYHRFVKFTLQYGFPTLQQLPDAEEAAEKEARQRAVAAAVEQARQRAAALKATDSSDGKDGDDNDGGGSQSSNSRDTATTTGSTGTRAGTKAAGDAGDGNTNTSEADGANPDSPEADRAENEGDITHGDMEVDFGASSDEEEEDDDIDDDDTNRGDEDNQSAPHGSPSTGTTAHKSDAGDPPVKAQPGGQAEAARADGEPKSNKSDKASGAKATTSPDSSPQSGPRPFAERVLRCQLPERLPRQLFIDTVLEHVGYAVTSLDVFTCLYNDFGHTVVL